MKTSKIISYLVIITLTVLYFSIFHNNEYMKFKIRKCVVIDRLQTEGGRKAAGRFYLVVKEERGIVFDIIVSPATFSQKKKDDVVYFNLRNFDIKQTPKENVIYFFGTVIVFLMMLGSWIIIIIYFGNKIIKKNKEKTNNFLKKY
jgi:hypothetical protein